LPKLFGKNDVAIKYAPSENHHENLENQVDAFIEAVRSAIPQVQNFISDFNNYSKPEIRNSKLGAKFNLVDFAKSSGLTPWIENFEVINPGKFVEGFDYSGLKIPKPILDSNSGKINEDAFDIVKNNLAIEIEADKRRKNIHNNKTPDSKINPKNVTKQMLTGITNIHQLDRIFDKFGKGIDTVDRENYIRHFDKLGSGDAKNILRLAEGNIHGTISNTFDMISGKNVSEGKSEILIDFFKSNPGSFQNIIGNKKEEISEDKTIQPPSYSPYSDIVPNNFIADEGIVLNSSSNEIEPIKDKRGGLKIKIGKTSSSVEDSNTGFKQEYSEELKFGNLGNAQVIMGEKHGEKYYVNNEAVPKIITEYINKMPTEEVINSNLKNLTSELTDFTVEKLNATGTVSDSGIIYNKIRRALIDAKSNPIVNMIDFDRLTNEEQSKTGAKHQDTKLVNKKIELLNSGLSENEAIKKILTPMSNSINESLEHKVTSNTVRYLIDKGDKDIFNSDGSFTEKGKASFSRMSDKIKPLVMKQLALRESAEIAKSKLIGTPAVKDSSGRISKPVIPEVIEYNDFTSKLNDYVVTNKSKSKDNDNEQ
jgi:hypothetical protein